MFNFLRPPSTFHKSLLRHDFHDNFDFKIERANKNCRRKTHTFFFSGRTTKMGGGVDKPSEQLSKNPLFFIK